jgi:hypothetical protein
MFHTFCAQSFPLSVSQIPFLFSAHAPVQVPCSHCAVARRSLSLEDLPTSSYGLDVMNIPSGYLT